MKSAWRCRSTGASALLGGSPHHAARRPAGAAGPDGHEEGVRPRAVRRMHRARRRPAHQLLPGAGASCYDGSEITTVEGLATARNCTRCRPRSSGTTGSSAATARRARSARPSRMLARSSGHGERRDAGHPAAGARGVHRRRDPRADERQHLPLRGLPGYRRRDPRGDQRRRERSAR